MVKKEGCTTIEIEDYYGNTFMNFMITPSIKTDSIHIKNGCTIADEEDDYLNHKCKNLIRLQSTIDWLKRID